MKRIWIILVCIAVGLISSPLYFWYQVTRLPEWYHDRTVAANTLDLSDRTAIQQARQTVDQKLSSIQPATDGSTEVELTDSELNALFASEVARVAETQNLKPAVKRISTNIADGRIESGAVINLRNLPADALTQTKQNAIVKLVKAFPGLSEREVYVGIEGTPSVADGQLKLDGTRLRIGNLNLSVTEVAHRLGISESALQENLIRLIPLDQVGIQSVQLRENAVKIQGRMN
ncbi:hypothetical protein [Leptothermofonsia sp. ETS-13]|uniref:hypothetical protein n=1 Tax=Leptothermofonsia sp. ETS-13 TaxID=3035696 RepID=UPI003B9DE43E